MWIFYRNTSFCPFKYFCNGNFSFIDSFCFVKNAKNNNFWNSSFGFCFIFASRYFPWRKCNFFTNYSDWFFNTSSLNLIFIFKILVLKSWLVALFDTCGLCIFYKKPKAASGCVLATVFSWQSYSVFNRNGWESQIF